MGERMGNVLKLVYVALAVLYGVATLVDKDTTEPEWQVALWVLASLAWLASCYLAEHRP